MAAARKFLRLYLLHGLGELPVPASNIVTSTSTFFLALLCLVSNADDIYRLAMECE